VTAARAVVGPLLLAAALLLAGCAGGAADGPAADVSTTGSSALHATAINGSYGLPPQTFTDTAGRPFVPARDADHPLTLLFFGYTHCPDVCNVVLANVASALRGADPAVRERVQLLFVTTDPVRDTRTVVREYLDRFDPSFAGLVAPVPVMRDAARSVHIAYGGTEAGSDGGYEVSHGTQLTAFAAGRARALWRAETPVGELRADLERLAGAGATGGAGPSR
jgi:protein SCO1/2